MYVLVVLSSTLYLIFQVSPELQASNVLVYVAICSIVGSLSGEHTPGSARQAARQPGSWLLLYLLCLN